MSDEPAVVIHQMIVHKVDHINYNAAQLSDLESYLLNRVGVSRNKRISWAMLLGNLAHVVIACRPLVWCKHQKVHSAESRQAHALRAN